MSKKKDAKIELTEVERDLLNGYLAQQEIVRKNAQESLVFLQGKIDGLAGEGRELKGEDGTVFKVEKAKE
jgi:hypothetical protein